MGQQVNCKVNLARRRDQPIGVVICRMLNFNPAWRFASPGAIAEGVPGDFFVFIKRVAGQHPNRQHVIEHYKRYFADAAGRPAYTSTSLGWAESDLNDYMTEAASNASLFIEAFYDAGTMIQMANPEFVVPDVATINSILAKHNAGFELAPPALVSRNPQTAIPVQERPPSLDVQAHEIIQRSLKKAEDDLAVGNGRQAVQEILWLLETVSTAFQGDTASRRCVPAGHCGSAERSRDRDGTRRPVAGDDYQQPAGAIRNLIGIECRRAA
jgi:hypothetical protein